MSNHLAIAAVTTLLKKLLSDGMKADGLSPYGISSHRPDGSNGATDTAANVYLYQVSPNAALRNMDLPNRDGAGRLIQQPRIALNLHYLVTFHGEETELQPQIRLGSAARTLHANPVLERAKIRALIQNANGAGDPGIDAIEQSGLADAMESVKFTPLSLNLEDLSRLWSVFLQTPYLLSIAYEASVVLIERPGVARAPLPVRERRVRALPFRRPQIAEIAHPDGQGGPFEEGDVAVLSGHRLRGNVTRLLVDGTEIDLASIPPTFAEHQPWLADTRVVLPLSEPPFPEGSLRAGLHAVQVVHFFQLEAGGELRRAFESNLGVLAIAPRVEFETLTTAEITVGTTPSVGPEQRVELILNGATGDPPLSYRFQAPSRDSAVDRLDFATPGLEAGDYYVRLRVDGAESALDPAEPQAISEA